MGYLLVMVGFLFLSNFVFSGGFDSSRSKAERKEAFKWSYEVAIFLVIAGVILYALSQ